MVGHSQPVLGEALASVVQSSRVPLATGLSKIRNAGPLLSEPKTNPAPFDWPLMKQRDSDKREKSGKPPHPVSAVGFFVGVVDGTVAHSNNSRTRTPWSLKDNGVQLFIAVSDKVTKAVLQLRTGDYRKLSLKVPGWRPPKPLLDMNVFGDLSCSRMTEGVEAGHQWLVTRTLVAPAVSQSPQGQGQLQ